MQAIKSILGLNEERYILKFEELMSLGDIILTADSTFMSFTIRKFTQSPFSHAILYTGNSYMHSTLEGVHSGNPQRLLFKNIDHVKVLRLKEEYRKSVDLHKVCSYARNKHGTQYGKIEASKSIFTNKAFETQNRQFCSRLVAQAYSSVGFKIVKDPNFCTPDDIMRSPFFEEVQDVIRLAEIEEIQFTYTKGVKDFQIEATNKLLKNVRIKLSADIQKVSDIDRFLIKNKNYDKIAVNILIDSQYLEFWKEDQRINPWRYNSETFINFKFPQSELEKYRKNHNVPDANFDHLKCGLALGQLKGFTKENQAENDAINYYLQKEQYKKLFELYGLEYFKKMYEHYSALLESCSTRISVSKNLLKHYGWNFPNE